MIKACREVIVHLYSFNNILIDQIIDAVRGGPLDILGGGGGVSDPKKNSCKKLNKKKKIPACA